MSYKSILVNLDVDGPVIPVVKAAADLASRCEAKLIGFCAADVPMPLAGPESSDLAAQVWMQMREDLEVRFKDLHKRFGKLVTGAVETGWRAALDNPTRALAEAARTADLIVMGAIEGVATGDAYRRADPGSVALQAGRPLLIVSQGTEQVSLDTVVVAWKDTREARRAVADAMPLMKLARAVIVVTIAAEIDRQIEESIADVVAFISAHGINVRSEVLQARNERDRLIEFVAASPATLVVSGAYGHSRLREWAFGGVTRSLLDETELSRFLSN